MTRMGTGPRDRQLPEQRTGTVAELLNSRANSLNTLRLAFATMVIYAHCFDLAGWPQPRLGDIGLGRFAVWAFFVLSGFLIAGSRERHSLFRYGWARFLRIYPAFWVCLIVTAFAFSTFASFFRGGWDAKDAVSYIVSNCTLYISQHSIGQTLAWSRIEIWNGPLWTLFFEFVCYIVVGVFFSVRRFRSGPAVLCLFSISSAASILAQIGLLTLSGHGLGLLILLAELLTFFLAGVVVHVYRHSIPVSLWLFLAAAAFVIVIGALGWAKPLSPLPLAYCALWLGIRMPPLIERIRGGGIDISYGTYIYAYPLQQLLVMAGLDRFGLVPLFAGSFAATAVFATASWFLVEKPCLRLKRVRWPFG